MKHLVGALVALVVAVLFAPVSAQAEEALVTLTPRPAVFYPTVRDDYRDTTVINFEVHSRYIEVMSAPRVLDGLGNEVTKIDDGPIYVGDYWAQGGPRYGPTWDGSTSTGETASVGTYTVELVVRDIDTDVTQTATATVQLAAGRITQRVTKYRSGYDNTSQRSTRGCDIHWGYWTEDDAFLDCWGGRYAWVKYRFRIPANATNLAWDIGGRSYCCRNGKLSRTGKRVSATSYVVTVKVTRWRAYDVRWVDLTYRYTHAG